MQTKQDMIGRKSVLSSYSSVTRPLWRPGHQPVRQNSLFYISESKEIFFLSFAWSQGRGRTLVPIFPITIKRFSSKVVWILFDTSLVQDNLITVPWQIWIQIEIKMARTPTLLFVSWSDVTWTDNQPHPVNYWSPTWMLNNCLKISGKRLSVPCV